MNSESIYTLGLSAKEENLINATHKQIEEENGTITHVFECVST